MDIDFMVNWKTIDELREILINRYIDSKLNSELEKACSEEYELKRDYNGRQILELLQNVDDACEENKSGETVEVYIGFKNNILEVGNTGTTFSSETIERLCLGRASNKSSQKIGNKGTGFRSLLNDAEWIEIYSGDFSIRFSEKYAKLLFEESYKKSPLIRQQKENWEKDYDFCFPIMNCPEQIEKRNNNKFDTLIRVKIKDENIAKDTSITNQLTQPFYKSLLFLPNITKIKIETEDSTNCFEKLVDRDDVLIQNSEKETEEYYVYSKEAAIKNKTADILMAIPKTKDFDFEKETLYCYFPIRNFKTPIHALIHAPFITNSSRDDISNDNELINKSIFKEIIVFIKDAAEKIATADASTLAIETLTPFEDNKLWDSDFFNLSDDYVKLVSSAKILPTINGELISISDEPKLFENEFPQEFRGKEFDKLLLPLSFESTKFLKDTASAIGYHNANYTAQEILEKINIIGDNWDVKTQVRIFIWWSEYYRSYDFIPNLLKNTNNNWVDKKSKVYLPTDGGISILPESLNWVELCILREDYVNELIAQLKFSRTDNWQNIKNRYTAESTGDKRILDAYSKQYLAIDFTEQSSSDLIIRPINNQIDSVEKSRTFINWFFNKYKDSLSEGSELSKIPFNLPNENYEIKSIKELYLGKDYGNPLAEKLFANTLYSPLLKLEELYEGDKKEEFVVFLKKCGILLFPEIFDDSGLDTKFFSFVKYNYFLNVSIYINYLTSKNIKHFDNLIEELKTQEIKEWLSKDEKLRNLLLSSENGSTAKQQSNWSPYYFASNAYIKFVLNNTEWIELEGKRYSPNKIIKYGKLKNKIDGYYGISEQDLIKELGKDIVNNFCLDFKDSFGDLSDTDIKTIVKSLPSFDKGEISRKLYLDIIKCKKDIKPSQSYSTADFLLLAMDGRFYSNKELRYADKKVPFLDEKKQHFIAIQTKQSIDTIENWFGVPRYKSNLVLKSSILMNDTKEFDSEIEDIKTAVLCCIDQNQVNVSRIKNLKIIPCSQIIAEDSEQGNRELSLENYFFVEYKKWYYVKLPEVEFSIDKLRCSDGFANSIIDIFKQTLNLDLDSNLIALLVSKNQLGKKQKIEDDYGIDQWNNAYGLLFNRNYINEQVLKFFKAARLSEELYKEISAIDFSMSLQEEDFEILRNSLKSVCLDISDLNNSVDNLNLDIRNFLKLEFEKMKNSKYESYRLILYKDLMEGTFGEKNQFLKKLDEYKNYLPREQSFENSIDVCIEKLLESKFSEITKTFDELDIDRIYNENVAKIRHALGITVGDFDYFIQDYQNKSVLYFEIPNDLCDDIKNFLKKDDNSNQDIENQSHKKESSTVKTRLESPSNKNIQRENKLRGEKSTRDYENRSAQNELAGKTAERIAYDELKKQYPNLIWHSKNSEIPADRNNLPPFGIVCDMWNRGDENSYFEIKSAIDEFQMSINEYRSMKNYSNNYEVVLVNRETAEISRHKFDELEKFKQINEYIFRFRQIKNED